MKKLGIFFFSIIFSISVIAGNVSPEGEFAEIDVKTQNKAFQKLSKGKSSYIDKVLKNPQKYNPTVLYALSSALFKKGKEEEAMFWFYAGQLRARSDANKSLDKSAGQGVDVLNQKFGTPINQYAFTNISNLEKTIEKVVAWDKETSREYDPRWIALHGMDAFLEKVVAFEPEEKWTSIDNITREEYLNGFKKTIEQNNPSKFEAVMQSFVQNAKSDNVEKMIALTSQVTIDKVGIDSLKAHYIKDTIPVLKACKKNSEGGDAIHISKAETGTGPGWVYRKTCTYGEGKIIQIQFIVLNENGRIVITSFGLV